MKCINGVDWDVEIGAVTEMGHHLGEQSSALLFDNIKGKRLGIPLEVEQIEAGHEDPEIRKRFERELHHKG